MKMQTYVKMRFYQDCGLNILVFGVGSKRDFLNQYVDEHIRRQGQNIVVVNGYHSATNLKSVFGGILNYIKHKTGQQKFPVSLND